MNINTIKLTTIAALGAITLTGCVTDPVTGERKISKAAIGGVGGALGGYLLGDLTATAPMPAPTISSVRLFLPPIRSPSR